MNNTPKAVADLLSSFPQIVAEERAVPTPDAIAEAMLAEFRKRGRLNHRIAVRLIRALSGDAHLHTNRNGNDAIGAAVLDAFRALTDAGDDDVVWSKHGHYWRLRKPSDPPGREVS